MVGWHLFVGGRSVPIVDHHRLIEMMRTHIVVAYIYKAHEFVINLSKHLVVC